MSETFISDWPGKSARDGGAEHPAAYHMLDVAAVAERLIAPAGVPQRMAAALMLLVCLHDLGKITPSFRAMLRQGAAQSIRHWEWSEILLQLHDKRLAARLGGDRHTRFALYAAVAGHHGRPPSISARDVAMHAGRLDPAARDDSAAFIDAVADLWPDGVLDGVTLAEAKALSWWLAGLTTAADWIGSNAGWFEPCPPGPDLKGYMQVARVRAAHAVAQAGLDPAAPRDGALFDFALRPMQTACAGADLPGGPVLAIIEDETGAGKTEAAMILAQRMLLAGKGAGLFLALPTMATADAMFARAGAVVGRMFDSPSVALAHGRSALSEAFRDVVGHAAREGEVTCAPWLADGRRKALLAHVGVGTVDQALLGVLPTRFATLRLWGLASKILIVDEVHEMGNPYMAQELQRLLEFHAGRGGSAILLTATLPLAQRQRLVDAFALGRSGHKPDVAQPDYPALTIVGADAVTKPVPVPALRANRGPVTVRRLGDAEAALDCLTRATGQGAACVWVRNAVDDAISAADALAARGVAVDLLHARLALCDRKHHEAAMLARFGKGGTDRAGRVLVATQVVESSLDLDFDVMVSDLAPMAALIQRAGRLWRHMDRRPADTRPAPEPVLHVLSPDPGAVSDDRWLQGVLDKGAWVYDLVECWRTARVLLRDGRIDAPGGLRDLIEAVHGAGAEPVPEAFSGAETEAEGNRYAEANRGWQNAVTWQDGYRNAGAGHSDTLYPTRLGAEQRVLVLARADGTGGLTPWAGGAGPEAWMLSEVQASAKRLGALPLPAQDTPAIRMATADWPEWKRDSVILCPVGEDGEICECLSYTRERGLLFLS